MANSDIQGTITNADGNAVSNATVYAWEEDSPNKAAVATTDSNGDYIFTSHPDGDGTSREWHVSAYYTDGSGNVVNTLSKPRITASLSSVIPDNPIGRFDATELSLSDGDSVSTWPDESSEGNDLSGGTAPTYRSSGINNNPSVEFDGGDDYLDVSTSTYSSPRTVVMAVEHTDGSDDFGVPFDGGTGNEHRSFVTSNGNVRLVSGSTDISDGTDARDTTSIFVFEADGANSRIRRNGQTLVTGGSTSDSDLTGFTVGVRGDTSANFYPGFIGELLVYNRELSSSEVSSVESYLSDKWGIAI